LSRLSRVKSSTFQDSLVLCNSVLGQEFAAWVFSPGMLFGARRKWWGDEGDRETPHEGLDLCFYRTHKGTILALAPGALIPSAFDGLVVKVSVDFLGKSLFIRHDGITAGRESLMTIFGHTAPVEGLEVGSRLTGGQVIGSVAEPKPGQRVPPHLHVSTAWVSNAITDSELDWDKIAGSEHLRLIDPLTMLQLPQSNR
jgi:murein DD-endopeptidase MepM/ murein hydrolase activator NlpD